MKRTSPCFTVDSDTQYKIKVLQRKTNLSKSALIEIALGELNEEQLLGILSGYSNESKNSKKEPNLFEFYQKRNYMKLIALASK